MKIKSILAIALLVILTACNTPQQRTAYNTVFTVEQTATAAVNGYFAMIATKQIATNDIPVVSRSYNQIQTACALAAMASQAGTNALAPAELTAELLQLTTLISSIENSVTNKSK